MFCRQNWWKKPVVKSNFKFPEKIFVHNFIDEMKMCEFFHENFAEWIFYLIVPMDVLSN